MGSKANIDRHLAVRDYLRASREAADTCVQLKERLAREHPYDIDSCCSNKDAFMKDLEQPALAWAGLGTDAQE